MLCELWIGYRYLKSPQTKKFISFSSLISITGIALGVCVLIVVISVMSGFDRYLEDKMIGTNSHIYVEFNEDARDPDTLMRRLEALGGVLSVAPIIQGQIIIKDSGQISVLQINGIEPKYQEKVTKIKDYLVQGNFYIKDNELLIGQELADILGLSVGDELSVNSSKTLKPLTFKIKGIFKTGMYLYDSTLVLAHISQVAKFLDIGLETRSFNMKIDNIHKTKLIKNQIIDTFKDDNLYVVRSWIDANRNFLHALKLEKIVIFIVVTMTTVVAAFGIIGSILMSVMAKIKDIGILRSIGARAKGILMVFLFKGTLMGLVEIIFGAVLGFWLSSSLNNIIDFLSSMIGRNLIPQDVYYFDRLPVSLNFNDIAIIVGCAFFIVLSASFYPAIYASRINPADAIRHE